MRDDLEGFISTKQAEKKYRVHRNTLLNLARSGSFTVKKINNKNYYVDYELFQYYNLLVELPFVVERVVKAPVAAPAKVQTNIREFLEEPVKQIYQQAGNCSYENGRSSSYEEDQRQLAMSGYNEPVIYDNTYRRQSSPEELKSVFEAPVVINPLAGIDFDYISKLSATQRDTYLKNWSINHAK
jgi:hypothetical protein